MSETVENWTYNDYLAFIMIYAASADLNIQESEKMLIRERVGDECYEKVMGIFEERNDMERIEIILQFKAEHIKDEAEKEKVLSDMKDVFMADKDYSTLEQNIFMAVQKLL